MEKTMPKFLRSLGATEKLASLINAKIPHNIVSIAKLNKNINKNNLPILEKAVISLKKEQPLMNCIIKNDAFYFSQWNQNLPIEFIENTNDSVASISEKLLQYQLSNTNYLFKIFVTNTKKNCSYIFFVAQHTICDGLSTIYAHKKLLLIFDELLTNQSYDKPNNINSELLPELEKLLPEAPKIQFKIDEKLPAKKNNYSPGDRSTGIYINSLSKKDTSQLIAYSKKIGVTINSIVITAALLALHKHTTFRMEKNLFGYNTMVDMRRFLTVDVASDYLGFYSGYIHKDISIGSTVFDHIAVKVNKEIKQSLNSSDHIAATKYYCKLITENINPEKLLDTIRIERPTVGVSNIGVIENFSYSNFCLDAMHYCVSSHPYSRNENTFFICALTHNDFFSFILHYPLPIFTRERAELFANDIKNQLVSL